ncbi:hypothetical protein BOS5A_30085 [Bosea sp. EC-HK365B]|nr:hypothetical protein BOSE21B_90045 [Bosea sp. 21B]CAD5299593.1 hypothetical protein BOSE7B_60620 [Bosea sp. 7B]VVT62224.1 hypothetical protein BOS5A_30085 [Bosea sp. EC-HK365B]VXB45387.1 hypothetical protein BOSE127_120083 [Bosea sp. 127]
MGIRDAGYERVRQERPDARRVHQPAPVFGRVGVGFDPTIRFQDLTVDESGLRNQHPETSPRLSRNPLVALGDEPDEAAQALPPIGVAMPNSAMWPRIALESWTGWRMSISRTRCSTMMLC